MTMGSAVVAIGGIRYETNSFAAPAQIDETSLRVGDEVLSPPSDTELAGALCAAERHGLGVVGTLDVFGGCGGPADHSQFIQLLDELCRQLASAPRVDGVMLALHGAFGTATIDGADAEIVRRVRSVVGPDVPVVASLDLHAAVDRALAENLDAVVGFKTCPHVDYEATGARAMTILARTLRGDVSPRIHWLPIPVITPAESHDTTDGPLAMHMRHLLEDIDGDERVLDASLFAVQPWLDAKRTSWSVTVTTDSTTDDPGPALAKSIRDRVLGDLASFRVHKARPQDAAKLVSRRRPPLLLADSGDSPSAGATGASTDLLAHLVGVRGARILATLTDADAARRLRTVSAGNVLEMCLGGVPELGISSLQLRVTVESIHDGRYLRSYPAGECDVGTCAVLSVGDHQIIVTERPAFMLDTSLVEHLGLDVGQFDAIVIKSAGGFRAKWARVSTDYHTFDTRGASTSRLDSLPFRHVDQGLFAATVADHRHETEQSG